MTSIAGRPRAASRFFAAGCALVLSMLAGCEDGLQTEDTSLGRALDGHWSFTFASTTPVGVNGARCLDGSGRVTVKDGRVVGSTFAEFAGALRAMGALEGRVLESEGGVVTTIASSQGGRNAFVAQGEETADGFAGSWEDIAECRGTFSAVRHGAGEEAAGS